MLNPLLNTGQKPLRLAMSQLGKSPLVYSRQGSPLHNVLSCFYFLRSSLIFPRCLYDEVCTDNVDLCSPNPCTSGLNIYLCADKQCQDSAFDCQFYYNCGKAGYTTCWDGSCQSDIRDCPTVPSCPVNTYR